MYGVNKFKIFKKFSEDLSENYKKYLFTYEYNYLKKEINIDQISLHNPVLLTEKIKKNLTLMKILKESNNFNYKNFILFKTVFKNLNKLFLKNSIAKHKDEKSDLKIYVFSLELINLIHFENKLTIEKIVNKILQAYNDDADSFVMIVIEVLKKYPLLTLNNKLNLIYSLSFILNQENFKNHKNYYLVEESYFEKLNSIFADFLSLNEDYSLQDKYLRTLINLSSDKYFQKLEEYFLFISCRIENYEIKNFPFITISKFFEKYFYRDQSLSNPTEFQKSVNYYLRYKKFITLIVKEHPDMINFTTFLNLFLIDCKIINSKKDFFLLANKENTDNKIFIKTLLDNILEQKEELQIFALYLISMFSQEFLELIFSDNDKEHFMKIEQMHLSIKKYFNNKIKIETEKTSKQIEKYFKFLQIIHNYDIKNQKISRFIKEIEKIKQNWINN
jgi:hypothetical protein